LVILGWESTASELENYLVPSQNRRSPLSHEVATVAIFTENGHLRSREAGRSAQSRADHNAGAHKFVKLEELHPFRLQLLPSVCSAEYSPITSHSESKTGEIRTIGVGVSKKVLAGGVEIFPVFVIDKTGRIEMRKDVVESFRTLNGAHCYFIGIQSTRLRGNVDTI
jgi:hypothetical protein